jgi:hypothetical protein
MTKADLVEEKRDWLLAYLVSNPEVMVFHAVATAAADNTLGYPKDEMHPMLIFFREKAGALRCRS